MKLNTTYRRILTLMVMMIMGTVGVWGETQLLYCEPGNNSQSSGALTVGEYAIAWSNFGGSNASNSATYNGKKYYKLSKDEGYVEIIGAESFIEGDVITIASYRNEAKAQDQLRGYKINNGEITANFQNQGEQVKELVYTITAADLSGDDKKITIKRKDSNAPFIHSITITRTADTQLNLFYFYDVTNSWMNNATLSPVSKVFTYKVPSSDAGKTYKVKAKPNKSGEGVANPATVTISPRQTSSVAAADRAGLGYSELTSVTITTPVAGGEDYYYLKVTDGSVSDYYELVVRTYEAFSSDRKVLVTDFYRDFTTATDWNGTESGYYTPTINSDGMSFTYTPDSNNPNDWGYQFYVRKDIPLAEGTEYRINANIKCTESDGDFNVQFGSWSPANMVEKHIPYTTTQEDQSVKMVAHTANNSIIFQPTNGKHFLMKSIMVTHEEEPDYDNRTGLASIQYIMDSPATDDIINHEHTDNGPWPITFTASDEHATVVVKNSDWSSTGGTASGNTYTCQISNAQTVGETKTYYIEVRYVDGTKTYLETYTLNLKKIAAPKNNISSAKVENDNLTIGSDNKIAYNFSNYASGGTNQLLSVVTEDANATVKISAKRPREADTWSAAGFSTTLTKAGTTNTVYLEAPLPGNYCFYYIQVEESNQKKYYELKLSTAAGGSVSVGTSGTVPALIEEDMAFFFDDITNSGTESPSGEYYTFDNGHFILGKTYYSATNKGTFNHQGSTHYNSLFMKGLDQAYYLAFKVKANAKVTIYNSGDPLGHLILTSDKTYGNINNSGVVLASTTSGVLTYTSPTEQTLYVSSHSKSGDTYGGGYDQYLGGIVVENETFGTGIKQLKINNQVIGASTLWRSDNDYYGYTVPKDYSGQTVLLELETEATNPTIKLTDLSDNTVTTVMNKQVNLAVPTDGGRHRYELEIKSGPNDETKTWNIHIGKDTDLTTVNTETTWDCFSNQTEGGAHVTNYYVTATSGQTTGYTLLARAGTNPDGKQTLACTNNKGLELYKHYGGSGANRTIEIPVSGKGTLTVSQYNSASVVLHAAAGAWNGTELTSTTNGVFYYTENNPASLFVYSDNNATISSITWTPASDLLTSIKTGGKEIIPNSERIFELVSAASTNVSVEVVPGMSGSTMKLSGPFDSPAETPEESDWETATSPLSLTSPTNPGATWYYKLKVLPPSQSAPSRVLSSEGEDVYVFAVTTVDDRGLDDVAWITGEDGDIPTGWKVYLDNYDNGEGNAKGGFAEYSDIQGADRPKNKTFSRVKAEFSGLATAGFYLAHRDAEGPTHLMAISSGYGPQIEIPKDKKVKFSVLVSGYKANAKLSYTLETDKAGGGYEVIPGGEFSATTVTTIIEQNGVLTQDKITRLTLELDLSGTSITADKFYLKINSETDNGMNEAIIWGYEIERSDEGLFAQVPGKKWLLNTGAGWSNPLPTGGQVNDNIKAFDTSGKQFAVDGDKFYLAHSADISSNLPQQGFVFIVNRPGTIRVNAASPGDSERKINIQQGSNSVGRTQLGTGANKKGVYVDVETRFEGYTDTKIYIYNSDGGTYFKSIEWIPDTYTLTDPSVTGQTILVGQASTLVATGLTSGYNMGYEWATCNPEIVSVDAEHGYIKGESAGQATITVTVKKSAYITASASCTVTVNDLNQLDASSTYIWKNLNSGSSETTLSNVQLFHDDDLTGGDDQYTLKLYPDVKLLKNNGGFQLGGGVWNNGVPSKKIAEIWTSGSGRITAKIESGSNERTMNIYVGDDSHLLETATTTKGITTTHVKDYKTNEAAHIFFTTAANSINVKELKWEPGLFPTISRTGSLNLNVGLGSSLSFKTLENLTGKWIVTVKDPVSGVEGVNIWKAAPTQTTNNSQTCTINIPSPQSFGTAKLVVRFEPTTTGYFSVEQEYDLKIRGEIPTITKATASYSVVVGGKSATSVSPDFTIKGHKYESGAWASSTDNDITNKGKFTYSFNENVELDENGFIYGLHAGEGKFKVTWIPTDPDYAGHYEPVTYENGEGSSSIPVTVTKGSLTMKFEPTSGIVAVGKSITPPVVFYNLQGKKVVGLTAKFGYDTTNRTDASNELAKLSDDGTWLTGAKASRTEGSDDIKYTYVYAYYEATDDYNGATTLANPPTLPGIADANSKVFKIRVDAERSGWLDIITEADYESPNMADYWWYDEGKGSDKIRNVNTREFNTRHSYLAGDDFFRFYASTTDDLVNTDLFKGLYMKAKESYLSFLASNHDKLVVDYYAVTSRNLELYAVNEEYYDKDEKGDKIPDPLLGSPGVELVASVNCQPGDYEAEFDISKLAGNNFFFLKTGGGGIYIKSIRFEKTRNETTLQIAPGEFTFSNNTPILRLRDNLAMQIYSSSQTTPTKPTAEDKTDGKIFHGMATVKVGNNMYNIPADSCRFVYKTRSDVVAAVDPETGLVTPNSVDKDTIFVVLQAGQIPDPAYPNDDTKKISFASAQAPIIIKYAEGVNVADVHFYMDPTNLTGKVNEFVLSSVNPPSSFPVAVPTETTGEKGPVTSAYLLTYKLIMDGGADLDESIAYVTNTTDATQGTTTGYTSDGKLLYDAETNPAGTIHVREGQDLPENCRVVVDFVSSSYVSQRSFYLVKYTNKLTIPELTVIAPKTNTIKELVNGGPRYEAAADKYCVYYDEGVTAGSGHYYRDENWQYHAAETDKANNFDRHEYDSGRDFFVRAGWERHDNAKDKLEYPLTFEFTLPSTCTNVKMYALVSDTRHAQEESATAPTGVTWTKTANAGVNKITLNLTHTDKYDVTGAKDTRGAYSKHIWLYLTDGENYWNGYYKLNYLASPLLTYDSSTHKVTVESKNKSGWDYASWSIHKDFRYTYDTSEPTLGSKKLGTPNEGNTFTGYSGNTLDITENSMIIASEEFEWFGGFKDGSRAFLTAPSKAYPVQIEDENVFYIEKSSDIEISKRTLRKTKTMPLDGSDEDVQLRVMFGMDDAWYSTGRDKTTKKDSWTKGGNALDGKPTEEGSIFSPIDLYSRRQAFKNNSSGGNANPYTEYNGQFATLIEAQNVEEDGGLYLAPMSGDFIRFEPERDGVISVWLRQNGATASGAGDRFDAFAKEALEVDENCNDNVKFGKLLLCLEYSDLNRRPVYVIDEDGVVMQRNTKPYTDDYMGINGVVADISAQSIFGSDMYYAWKFNLKMLKDKTENGGKLWKKLKENYETYIAAYNGWTSKDKVGKVSAKAWTDFEDNFDKGNRNYIEIMKFFAQRCDFIWDDEDNLSIQSPLREIVYCDNHDDTKNLFYRYGFEIPNPNYVRYRFPVKAGKTYYIGGRGTKNMFSAVKFDEKTNVVAANVDIYDDGTLSDKHRWMTTTPKGALLNVTLRRKFTQNAIHPLVLPFSVSESKMQELFGADVKVIFLDEAMGHTNYSNRNAVQGNTLVFTKHFYQMVYANVPCFVIPSKTTDETVVFNNVTYAGNKIKSHYISDDNSKYEVVGSYEPTTAAQNGAMYFINNTINDGVCTKIELYRHKGGTNGSVPMKATRVWIKEHSASRSIADDIQYVGFEHFYGDGLGNLFMDIDDRGIEENMPTESNIYGTDRNIYNAQGLVVGMVTETKPLDYWKSRLAAGIYIYYGKKFVVR